MSFKSAQLFVEEMKVNNSFRNLMSNVKDEDSLRALLKEKRYNFDQKDLIQAMAGCMAEMDEMMEKQNK